MDVAGAGLEAESVTDITMPSSSEGELWPSFSEGELWPSSSEGEL